MFDSVALLISVTSGGLSGACVSIFSNRLFRRRELRTKFYPLLNDIFAAYTIRMAHPDGRFWLTVIGDKPLNRDEEFVGRRTEFVMRLTDFNELREARKLRQKLICNLMQFTGPSGALVKIDLQPESEALADCMKTLHKKLKL